MNKNYRLLTIFAKKSPSQMFDSDTKYISEISTSFARIATCNFKIRRINYRCFSVRLTKVFKQLFCRTPVNTIVGTAWKVSVSGFSLVRILPHKEYLHVFSPNAEKYGPEKLRIRTLSRSDTSFRAFTTLHLCNSFYLIDRDSINWL